MRRLFLDNFESRVTEEIEAFSNNGAKCMTTEIIRLQMNDPLVTEVLTYSSADIINRDFELAREDTLNQNSIPHVPIRAFIAFLIVISFHKNRE